MSAARNASAAISLGTDRPGGVLIVGDHASGHVPPDIALGIDPLLLSDHIAIDIGVAEVAALLVTEHGFAAHLGMVSRLVVDLNRAPDDPAAVPRSSDGIAIPGNVLTPAERTARIARWHAPYHDALAARIAAARPALILSLHSFTPALRTRDEARPWEIGILYGRSASPSDKAIGWLAGQGIRVGDQLPYSGLHLNATMDRHAEAAGIAYVGVEMRQDLVADATGQARFSALLGQMARHLLTGLASGARI